MSTQNIISAALVAGFISVVAFVYGYVRGRAYGWQEGFFEREAAERRKRDHLGRFKPQKS
jgi:hypothetical protein